MPPSPFFLPYRKSPSDLTFNGDLAQPAVSEPTTDVSSPPDDAVSELEGSRLCLSHRPQFSWGNRGCGEGLRDLPQDLYFSTSRPPWLSVAEALRLLQCPG